MGKNRLHPVQAEGARRMAGLAPGQEEHRRVRILRNFAGILDAILVVVEVIQAEELDGKDLEERATDHGWSGGKSWKRGVAGGIWTQPWQVQATNYVVVDLFF